MLGKKDSLYSFWWCSLEYFRESHLHLESLLTASSSIVAGSRIRFIQSMTTTATSTQKSSHCHTMVSSPCLPYQSMTVIWWPMYSKQKISKCCLWFYRRHGLGINALVLFCNSLASESGMDDDKEVETWAHKQLVLVLKQCAVLTKHYSFLFFLPTKWIHVYQSRC